MNARARPPAGSPATPSTAKRTIASFALAGRLFVCDVELGGARELTGRRTGVRSPSRPARPAHRLRQRRHVARRRARRHVARPRRRRRRARVGDVGQRRLHRRRGDAPPTRLLVEPRWLDDRRRRASTRLRSPRHGSPIRRSRRRPPGQRRYPFAGTDNADVSLHLVGLAGEVVDVEWDRAGFPYLADVHWSAAGLIISTQSRSQRALEILDVDVDSGQTDGALRRLRRSVGRARHRHAPPVDRGELVTAPTGTAPGGCWSTVRR